jgi:hypothetical protein
MSAVKEVRAVAEQHKKETAKQLTGRTVVMDQDSRRRYEEALQKWDEKLEWLNTAYRDSERLSKDDLAVRINTRD